eukprot:m.16653 g.16653  ORF g.16653 m.16653 type:complete len:567 (-) comp7155_c0_seq2:76-1776(-)
MSDDDFVMSDDEDSEFGESDFADMYDDSDNDLHQTAMQYHEPSEEPPTLDCLDVNDALQIIEGLAEQIAEITALSPDTALSMLPSFRWNTDATIQAILTNPAIFDELSLQPEITPAEAEEQMEGATECPICMEDGPETMLQSFMPCNHIACRQCWCGYVESKPTEGLSITCLSFGCQRPLPFHAALGLVQSSQRHTSLYKKAVVESFVRNSKLHMWCPSPGCETVVKTSFAVDGGLGAVTCRRCNGSFCFECGVYHIPATCQMRNDFSKFEQTADMNWLVKNTKECPRCTAPIYKDGGCNWVECSKCKLGFCWQCGHEIAHREIDAAGGGHRCNVFKEDEAPASGKQAAAEAAPVKATKGKRTKAKQEKITGFQADSQRRRQAHFVTRSALQQQSCKLEQQQFAIFSHLPHSTEKELVMQSLEQLRVARQCLQYSYVFAYYKDWGANKNGMLMFQDAQAMLQTRTEGLSKALERELQQLLQEPSAASAVSSPVDSQPPLRTPSSSRSSRSSSSQSQSKSSIPFVHPMAIKEKVLSPKSCSELNSLSSAINSAINSLISHCHVDMTH